MKQPYEVMHHKIPSLMPLLRLLPDYDIRKFNEYSFYYIEYLIHFMKYGQLAIDPTFEMKAIHKEIKAYQNEDEFPDVYVNYIDNLTRLLCANQVNGKDRTHLYAFFNTLFNDDQDYTWSKFLIRIKNDCFFKLLKNIVLITNPKQKRGEYLVKNLISSIKNSISNNLQIFSKNSGGKLIELIHYCMNLNLYDKYKSDIFHILKTYLATNASMLNENNYDADSLNIFRIGQFLIEQKEYQFFTFLVNLLHDKEHLSPAEEQKLNALMYALKLQIQPPIELKQIYNRSHYKQLPDVSYPSHSLEDWVPKTMMNNLDVSCFYKVLFISLVKKNYSAKEIINYFSPKIPFQEQFTNNDKALIRQLLKEFNENILKSLDMDTKVNLLHLYKLCNMDSLSFDFFNLLANLSDEDQLKLINYYQSNFNIDKPHKGGVITPGFFLSAYPLTPSTKTPPFIDRKVALPTGFYMHYTNNETLLASSFELGILRIKKDPYSIPFKTLESLIKRRNSFIVFNANGSGIEDKFFYVDISRKEISEIPSTEANKKKLAQLNLKCTDVYQLADKNSCEMIMSLAGLSPSYLWFYQRFHKAKDSLIQQAGVQYDIDYFDLMQIYAIKLFNLYEFMGDDLFLFLRNLISPSPKKLERYLKHLELIPPEYFRILQLAQKKFSHQSTKSESETFEFFLMQIGQLELVLAELNETTMAFKHHKVILLEQLESLSQHAKSLGDLTEFLAKETGMLYKSLLNIATKQEVDLSELIQEPLLLSRLLIARKVMQENQLRAVFDTLIEYDIRKDVRLSDLANNPNQYHPFGKKLSLYNQNIEHLLEKAQIKVKLALNYPEQTHFSIGDNDENNLALLASTLYADIKNLEQLLSSKNTMTFFEKKEDMKLNYAHEIREINKYINKIKNQVEKQNDKIQTIHIQNKSVNSFITIIENHLQTLLRQEVCKVSQEIQNLGTNFLKHNKQLMAAQSTEKKPQKNVQKAEQQKSFYIAQWDKNQLETFRLGDYLGCCLAPDGEQFPAMVQRRMDAGTLAHVVYDKSLNEPVCGNWLFLAYDTNRPEDIYVVANFFEIRAGYGQNKELNAKLVAELLAFTGQYADTIGAKGFLIRPLIYGLIPDFKNQYPTKNISLGKVGGFFNPELNEPQENTKERYYLKALELDKFYLYQPEPCENQLERSSISLKF